LPLSRIHCGVRHANQYAAVANARHLNVTSNLLKGVPHLVGLMKDGRAIEVVRLAGTDQSQDFSLFRNDLLRQIVSLVYVLCCDAPRCDV
jgi:hypothetical protein